MNHNFKVLFQLKTCARSFFSSLSSFLICSFYFYVYGSPTTQQRGAFKNIAWKNEEGGESCINFLEFFLLLVI